MSTKKLPRKPKSKTDDIESLTTKEFTLSKKARKRIRHRVPPRTTKHPGRAPPKSSTGKKRQLPSKSGSYRQRTSKKENAAAKTRQSNVVTFTNQENKNSRTGENLARAPSLTVPSEPVEIIKPTDGGRYIFINHLEVHQGGTKESNTHTYDKKIVPILAIITAFLVALAAYYNYRAARAKDPTTEAEVYTPTVNLSPTSSIGTPQPLMNPSITPTPSPFDASTISAGQKSHGTSKHRGTRSSDKPDNFIHTPDAAATKTQSVKNSPTKTSSKNTVTPTSTVSNTFTVTTTLSPMPSVTPVVSITDMPTFGSTDTTTQTPTPTASGTPTALGKVTATKSPVPPTSTKEVVLSPQTSVTPSTTKTNLPTPLPIQTSSKVPEETPAPTVGATKTPIPVLPTDTATPKLALTPLPDELEHTLLISGQIVCRQWELTVITNPSDAEISYDPSRFGKWLGKKVISVVVTARWPDGVTQVELVQLDRPQGCDTDDKAD